MLCAGRILKGVGGFYSVETADFVCVCRARGVLRRGGLTPLAGDLVNVRIREGAENTVEEILPRRNFLNRPPVANIDVLMIVASTLKPRPSTLILDKLTALAEYKGIEPVVIVTKSDLLPAGELVSVYRKAGFISISVSSETGEGVERVRGLLAGRVCAFTGNTGVGKTSLLNRLAPELRLATGAVSEKLGRGRHTTREAQLFRVAGGYVADTAGFSSLELPPSERIRREELAACFREFRPYLGQCRFPGCSHIGDKGCRILRAVADGSIGKSRYDSYAAMYDEVKDLKEWQL